uniref:Uncharacterized protein n=1 Tax=Oryza nivara TaxID=4536 RepID=A0A0E0GAV6_ORYNI
MRIGEPTGLTNRAAFPARLCRVRQHRPSRRGGGGATGEGTYVAAAIRRLPSPPPALNPSRSARRLPSHRPHPARRGASTRRPSAVRAHSRGLITPHTSPVRSGRCLPLKLAHLSPRCASWLACTKGQLPAEVSMIECSCLFSIASSTIVVMFCGDFPVSRCRMIMPKEYTSQRGASSPVDKNSGSIVISGVVFSEKLADVQLAYKVGIKKNVHGVQITMNNRVLLGLFLRQHQTRSQSRRYDFTQRWDEMPFALALA